MRMSARVDRSEAGFSLIEVTLAFVLLLVAVLATSSLVVTALKVGTNSKLKEVATDIASSVLDCAVQQGGGTLLSELNYGPPSSACDGATVTSGTVSYGTVTENGATYSVEQDVSPGAGSCAAPQPGVGNELQVREFVTWAPRPAGTWWTGSTITGRQVEESSYAAVPASAINTSLGELLVLVSDGESVGEGGVSVTAIDTSTSPATQLPAAATSPDGCVLFANIPVGDYTVTAAGEAGWLGTAETSTASASITPAVVVAGAPTTAVVKYAPAATISAAYKVSAGNPPANIDQLPLSFYNSALTTSDPYVPAVTSGDSYQVFPFASPSYSVVAGGCGPDSAPDGPALDGQVASVADGGSTTVTFPLTAIDVVVTDPSGPAVPATVTATPSTSTGAPDPACSAAGELSLQLGSTPVQASAVRGLGDTAQLPTAVLASMLHRHGTGLGRRAGGRRAGGRRAGGRRIRQPGGAAPGHAELAAVIHALPPLPAILTWAYGYQTSTALTTSPNPSAYGQTVTLTATVSNDSFFGGTPTGSVTFSDGSTQLGTVTLDASGVATLSTPDLPAGSDALTAVYSGGGSFYGSQSATVDQTVDQGPSTTSLTASPTSTTYGSQVTLTASVTAPSPAPTPTGSVTFAVGSTTLGTAAVSSGTATLVTSALPVGTDAVTATYGGDTDNAGSTSTAATVTVGQVGSTTALAVSPSSAFVGQGVTLTATVTPVSGTGTPTGTVTFLNGTTTLGTATVSGGTASVTTTSLPAGTDTVTAEYGGDANVTGSTSGPQAVTVSTASQPDATGLPYGTFALTATAVSGGTTYTGTVVVKVLQVNGVAEIEVGGGAAEPAGSTVVITVAS